MLPLITRIVFSILYLTCLFCPAMKAMEVIDNGLEKPEFLEKGVNDLDDHYKSLEPFPLYNGSCEMSDGHVGRCKAVKNAAPVPKIWHSLPLQIR